MVACEGTVTACLVPDSNFQLLLTGPNVTLHAHGGCDKKPKSFALRFQYLVHYPALGNSATQGRL